jgi:predicted nucleotidyltransferase
MDALGLAKEHARLLVGVRGVVGVMLGGSQARGTAGPSSDIDLGVYYRDPLDVEALQVLAEQVTGRPTDVARPGGWGRWVNGGAWLDIGDLRVDWILRDLSRAEKQWDDARHGRFSVQHQPGHPFGFVSTTYVAEVALGLIAGDPSGELTALKAVTAAYPQALRKAFADWLWEAGFSLDVAGKAAGRGDAAYVSMCVTHAVGVMAHALHAHGGAWVTNEKGLIDSAGRLPGAPEDFAAQAHLLCAGYGPRPDDLEARLAAAKVLLAEVEAAVRLS